jgi:hypothetical protein
MIIGFVPRSRRGKVSFTAMSDVPERIRGGQFQARTRESRLKGRKAGCFATGSAFVRVAVPPDRTRRKVPST